MDCVVFGCKKRKGSRKIKLFPIPWDRRELAESWIQNLTTSGTPAAIISDNSHVCSRHFEEGEEVLDRVPTLSLQPEPWVSPELEKKILTKPAKPKPKKKRGGPRLKYVPTKNYSTRIREGIAVDAPTRFTPGRVKDRPWKISEKKKILQALKIYESDDLDNISRFLPRRSLEEITRFLSSASTRAESIFIPEYDSYHKTPIELWLQVAEDLIAEDMDFSKTLPRALSSIASCEFHETPICNKVPNYEGLYMYLNSLLNGYSPQKITALDASVLVELIQDLAHQLTVRETSTQRLLVEKKYHLLIECMRNQSGDKGNAIIQKALQEDLLHDNDNESELNRLASESASSQADCQTVNASTTPSKPSTSSSNKKPTLKKSSLFSLNPLCIPVKYLRPALKQGALEPHIKLPMRRKRRKNIEVLDGELNGTGVSDKIIAAIRAAMAHAASANNQAAQVRIEIDSDDERIPEWVEPPRKHRRTSKSANMHPTQAQPTGSHDSESETDDKSTLEETKAAYGMADDEEDDKAVVSVDSYTCRPIGEAVMVNREQLPLTNSKDVGSLAQAVLVATTHQTNGQSTASHHSSGHYVTTHPVNTHPVNTHPVNTHSATTHSPTTNPSNIQHSDQSNAIMNMATKIAGKRSKKQSKKVSSDDTSTNVAMNLGQCSQPVVEPAVGLDVTSVSSDITVVKQEPPSGADVWKYIDGEFKLCRVQKIWKHVDGEFKEIVKHIPI